MLICRPKLEEPWNMIIFLNHYDNFPSCRGKGKLEKLFPFFFPLFFDDVEVTTYHPIHLQQHWLFFQSWKNYVYEIQNHFCNNEPY